jgi:tRNA modification GTPase
MNNKIDLTEAEGLADLINAQTEQQRIQALAVYSVRVARQPAAMHTPDRY